MDDDRSETADPLQTPPPCRWTGARSSSSSTPAGPTGGMWSPPSSAPSWSGHWTPESATSSAPTAPPRLRGAPRHPHRDRPLAGGVDRRLQRRRPAPRAGSGLGLAPAPRRAGCGGAGGLRLVGPEPRPARVRPGQRPGGGCSRAGRGAGAPTESRRSSRGLVSNLRYTSATAQIYYGSGYACCPPAPTAATGSPAGRCGAGDPGCADALGPLGPSSAGPAHLSGGSDC